MQAEELIEKLEKHIGIEVVLEDVYTGAWSSIKQVDVVDGKVVLVGGMLPVINKENL